jgi:hypothetical protein
MKNEIINKLIESIPFIIRQLNQYGAGVNMADNDYKILVGLDFFEYFSNNPNGETSKYIWETVKSDELINLKIQKKES